MGIAYNSNRTVTHRANGGFQVLDRVSVRPTGSWTNDLSVLAEGLNPTKRETRSLGLSTAWTKKLLRVPYARLGLNSAEFQFSRNDSAQYDASWPPQLDTESSQRVYALVFPYDINRKAQGNLRLSQTKGETNQRGIESSDNNYSAQLEYNQKFLQNKVLRIPGLNLKIKFHQAMELRLILLTELLRKDSDTLTVRQSSKRNRGTVEMNYNALKNIRSGLSFSMEKYRHDDPNQSYNLWQGSLSIEARF
jgi:hypothetical protein